MHLKTEVTDEAYCLSNYCPHCEPWGKMHICMQDAHCSIEL